MYVEAIITSWDTARCRFFKWRVMANTLQMIAMACLMACITGVMAQIRIQLPWTPVPITGQTFAVMLSGVMLGGIWGGISQLIYLIGGMAGIPWFSGFNAGGVYIFGPTGGYLMGFIFASGFVGLITDGNIQARRLRILIPLMLFANFILIYGPGILYLAVWNKAISGRWNTFGSLMSAGVLPFILGDIVKIAASAIVATTLSPKCNIGTEWSTRKGNGQNG